MIRAGETGGVLDTILDRLSNYLEAAEDLKIDLAKSFMIGDRWRDVDCGFNAGCRTVFIDWGYDEQLKQRPHLRARDLLHAAQQIELLKREI